MTAQTPGPEADFTEQAYAHHLRTAGDSYAFEAFGTECPDPHVLWRHDVDLSVHRALRLAEIEAEQGARATYFFLLGSSFYNLFERPVRALARRIIGLGHDLGVHLELPAGAATAEAIAPGLRRDREVLEQLLEAPARAFSFHNPGFGNNALSVTDDQVDGLVNAYGERLRARYAYVSDSNGYWRFQSLTQALAEGEPRLQVLTHPGWWQAEQLEPRARIARCVEGRAAATLRDYDRTLERAGRENR